MDSSTGNFQLKNCFLLIPSFFPFGWVSVFVSFLKLIAILSRVSLPGVQLRRTEFRPPFIGSMYLSLFYLSHFFLHNAYRNWGNLCVYRWNYRVAWFSFRSLRSFRANSLKHANRNWIACSFHILNQKGIIIAMNLARNNTRSLHIGCFRNFCSRKNSVERKFRMWLVLYASWGTFTYFSVFNLTRTFFIYNHSCRGGGNSPRTWTNYNFCFGWLWIIKKWICTLTNIFIPIVRR